MISNFFLRVASACLLIPVFLLFIFLASPLYFSLFCGFLSFVCCFEFLSFNKYPHFILLLFSSFSFFICLSFSHSIYFFAALYALLFIASFLALFFSHEFSHSFLFLCHSFYSVSYTALLFGLMSYLFQSHSYGRFFVFSIFLSSSFCDIFAYLFGRFLGKKKIVPRISPSKTIVGSLGGVLGTLLSLLLAKYLFLDFLDYSSLFLFFIVFAFSFQAGDLLESFFKRTFSVKDSGKIIPGHGGFFDRLDSVVFSVPAYFVFSLLF